MSQPNPKTAEQPKPKGDPGGSSPMTAADAAKLVKRSVVKTKDGKSVLDEKTKQPLTELAPIDANEVMAFADYGDHVVVVTTSGEKLRGEKGGK
ncbi:MAG: hypothetical protein AB1450_05010 [Pseudomonadota bacterium]